MVQPTENRQAIYPIACRLRVFREIMFPRIGKCPVEFLRSRFADLQFRAHHVKGVDVGAVNVHICGNPRAFQRFDVVKRLHVKRFSVPHKGIGRRQTGNVLRPCRGGIGGDMPLRRAPEVELSCNMILSGVPDLSVVVPGAFRVPVIQHGIQRHLKRNVDGRPVPRHQAHRRAQAALSPPTMI